MHSPQIHQDIARYRQADMLREAHRERLAFVAAAGKPKSLGMLARVGRAFPLKRRALVAGGQPAIDPAA